jgi:hypothetical protein
MMLSNDNISYVLKGSFIAVILSSMCAHNLYIYSNNNFFNTATAVIFNKCTRMHARLTLSTI